MNLTDDIATQLKQSRATIGTFSGTTDSNGFFVFAHGLTAAPSKVFIFPNGSAFSPNLAVPFLYAVDGLNVTLSYAAIVGSAASLAIAGSYLLLV